MRKNTEDLEAIMHEIAEEMDVSIDTVRQAYNLGVADTMTGFIQNPHKKHANRQQVAKNRTKRKQAKKTKRKNRG